MNSYKLSYSFDAKKPLKIALLALALGADIANIAFLIAATGGDYKQFAYLAVGIVAMLAFRLPTLKLTYRLDYVFKDGFAVYRVYPHRKELVCCLSDFEIYGFDKEKDVLPERVKKLYSYEGDAAVYILSAKECDYAVALDDYMLALILSFYGKKIKSEPYAPRVAEV